MWKFYVTNMLLVLWFIKSTLIICFMIRFIKRCSKNLKPPTMEHSKLSRVSPKVHFITSVTGPIVKVTPVASNKLSIA